MLAKFSVKKPYTVVVAVIVVLLLGIISFMGMQTDLLPSIDLPYAVVMTTYAGANPEEVETVVTRAVEQSMATVSNVNNVSSISSENMSLVILEFHQGTNMDSVTLDMRENLDLVASAWDNEAIGTPMIMKINPDMLPVMIASVDKDGMDDAELSAFVDDTLLPQLERIEGVASVEAMGMVEHEVTVTIDADRIATVNEAIAAAIDGDIATARSMLNSARSQLSAASAQLEAELAENTQVLDDAAAQIADGEKALNDAEAQLDAGLAALTQQKQELESQQQSLTAEKAAVEQQIADLTEAGEEVPAELTASLETIQDGLDQVQSGLDTVNGEIAEAEAGKNELAAQRETLNSQKAEIEQGRTILQQESENARAQIASGRSQISQQESALNSQAAQAKEQASIDDAITVEMISGILAAENFSMPAGTMESENGDYTVKVGNAYGNIEELENQLLFELGIDGVDDVRLKDVATVSVDSTSGNSYTKVNGNPGLLLVMQKQSTASTSEVSDNINEAIASLEKEYDITVTSFMDQGIYIDMVVSSVLDNLILGGILAIIILFLFMRDIRPTAVVAISIPASVLFALVMMYFTGVTLNIISLSGLALGVGMLVDNSIVVIENIYRLRKEGMDRIQAAVEGAKGVGGAIIASTLTTICVFLPIVFTDGMSRELFMDMGLTIAFSLIASLLVALSLVPSMAAGVLRKDLPEDRKFFVKMKRSYERLLRWTLGHRALVLLFSVALLFGSAIAEVSRGTSFMPEADSTEMTATLEAGEDMSQSDFWAAADQLMAAAGEIEDIEAVGAMDGNGMGLSTGSDSGNTISMYIILKEDKEQSNREIARELEDSMADSGCELEVSTSSMDMSMLGGSGIQLHVAGDDLETMGTVVRGLEKELQNIEGLVDITGSMEEASPQLSIVVDKDKAMAEGLTVAQVYSQVSEGIQSENEATTITVENQDYPVIVVDGTRDAMTAETMQDMVIEATAQDGSVSEVPLGDIATIGETESPSSIYRENQERYMTVSADVDDSHNVSLVSNDVQEVIDDYELPDGITVEIQGESVTVGDAVADLIKVILLALVLTYLIMVAQFQSLRSPFIVMFTIPLAFTGGFLALLISGFDVSVIALLGFLVLTGVVVNNGIVLVDCINQLRLDGMELREAIVAAGKIRLRPILMTALTTILALITMAFGYGMGAEMVQPMAIVCVGGLTYATFMTLFVVPVMYDLFHRKVPKGKKKLGQKGEEKDLIPAEEDS